jgi:hypothetical protein
MTSKLLLTTLASATLLVGGCAVYPAYDSYYDGYDAPVVHVAPPPPQYEYIGAPPVMGHVWIGGYWDWVDRSNRYHWVPGRWDAPRPGHIWTPYRWERDGDRWRRNGGRWEPDRHPQPRPHVIPPAPSPRFDHRDGPSGMPPPPRYERRDDPSGFPSSPRYERREAPQVVPPPAPVIRQGPPPPNPPATIERERREDRRNGDRNDRRGRDRGGDRDGIGAGPDWREGQRP